MHGLHPIHETDAARQNGKQIHQHAAESLFILPQLLMEQGLAEAFHRAEIILHRKRDQGLGMGFQLGEIDQHIAVQRLGGQGQLLAAGKPHLPGGAEMNQLNRQPLETRGIAAGPHDRGGPAKGRRIADGDMGALVQAPLCRGGDKFGMGAGQAIVAVAGNEIGLQHHPAADGKAKTDGCGKSGQMFLHGPAVIAGALNDRYLAGCDFHGLLTVIDS